jgi:hypothetical protein
MSQTNWVDVDFDVEKEVWNVYDLADGTRLKMRTILTKLQRRPGAKVGEFEYNAAFQNLVMTSVHPRNKGPPGKMYTEQEAASLSPKEEVNFTPELEDWNIYRLPDGSRIKTKVVVSSIQKVKAEGVYNIYGEPLYLAHSTNVVAPVPKTS